MSRLNVFLFEDEEKVREEIHGLLAEHDDLTLVSESATGHEGLPKAEAWNPDIVLVDDTLPDMSSLRLVSELRERLPQVQVLILSSGEYFPSDALASDAEGFLAKGALADLPLTIREIASQKEEVGETRSVGPGEEIAASAEAGRLEPEPEVEEAARPTGRGGKRFFYIITTALAVLLVTDVLLVAYLLQMAGLEAALWWLWEWGVWMWTGLWWLWEWGLWVWAGLGAAAQVAIFAVPGVGGLLYLAWRVARPWARGMSRRKGGEPSQRKGRLLLPHPRSQPSTGILVVESQEAMQKGLANLLESHEGFQVLGTATDGRQALEMTEMVSPEVVVMAVNLPGLNGIEVTTMIKSKYPQMKVILSASDGSYQAQALSAGASGYVLRETLLRDLVEMIESAIKTPVAKAEATKWMEGEIGLVSRSAPQADEEEAREPEPAPIGSLAETHLVVAQVPSFSAAAALKDVLEHISGVSDVVIQGLQEGTFRLMVQHTKGIPLVDTILNLPEFSFQLVSPGPGLVSLELEDYLQEGKALSGTA